MRRWKDELRGDVAHVSIFSPYITSKTAELVVQAVPPQRCAIHTSFSLENFAAGASSLRTLRFLVAAGFSLYQVPNLHAKIVLVPGRFASVGSQNLTQQGGRNKEATVVFTTLREIRRIEGLVVPWVAERQPITSEMIEEAAAILPSLVLHFRTMRHEAVTAEHLIQERIAARNQERLDRMRAQLAQLSRAHATVVARVTRVEQPRWAVFGGPNETRSLLTSPRNDLTRWSVDGELIKLERMTRYICINADTGKFGWARVGKTRITFVADEITGLKTTLVGVECNLNFSALWKGHQRSGENLQIAIAPDGSKHPLKIQAWFGLNELDVVRVAGGDKSRRLKSLATWIGQNERMFAEAILQQLLKPFQYIHNLYGTEADKFFGPIGSRYRLGLRKLAERPLLVAEQL